MTVERNGSQPQSPAEEIKNIAQSRKNVSRDIIETRVARRVYEFNVNADLKIDENEFQTNKHRDDWRDRVENMPTMGD